MNVVSGNFRSRAGEATFINPRKDKQDQNKEMTHFSGQSDMT